MLIRKSKWSTVENYDNIFCHIFKFFAAMIWNLSISSLISILITFIRKFSLQGCTVVALFTYAKHICVCLCGWFIQHPFQPELWSSIGIHREKYFMLKYEKRSHFATPQPNFMADTYGSFESWWDSTFSFSVTNSSTEKTAFAALLHLIST